MMQHRVGIGDLERIAGLIGLMLMTVGLDSIEAVPRMTFGVTEMLQGVNLLVAMIGLFAVPQILTTFLDHGQGSKLDAVDHRVRARLPKFSDLRARFGLMLRCAGIGTCIGSIPGICRVRFPSHLPASCFRLLT